MLRKHKSSSAMDELKALIRYLTYSKHDRQGYPCLAENASCCCSVSDVYFAIQRLRLLYCEKHRTRSESRSASTLLDGLPRSGGFKSNPLYRQVVERELFRKVEVCWEVLYRWAANEDYRACFCGSSLIWHGDLEQLIHGTTL